MAPELSRLTRQVTFVLLVLAVAATELAAVDTRGLPTSLALAAVWVGLAAGLGWLIPAPKDSRALPPRFVLLLLLGLAAAPILVEPLRRKWTGDGYALELRLIFVLRNLGLGLAACSCWWLCLRLASAISLFLMLFALSLTDQPAVLLLLGLYTATGSVWLMLVYWTGLRRFFVHAETSVALEIKPGKEQLPWVAVFFIVGLVSCVLGLVVIGPQRTIQVLGEWVPTSGGTGGYDPFARGGVNDGDDEVKGDNPKTVGTLETDTFLDSPLPSLYDMINDTYGEPFKPKDQEHAIALDSKTKVLESRKPPASNLRPNREFPTTRKSPRRPRDASDRAARALFEVQGRTPLHMRVTTFDAFDGTSWREIPWTKNIGGLEQEPRNFWMLVRQRDPALCSAETEQHQVKITQPIGSLVPVPAQLVRFRVGRVNRADFFALGQDGILRLAQRKTPPGVVVQTESRTIDPRRLETVVFPTNSTGYRSQHATLPNTLNPEVSTLVHEWVADRARGWPQLVAILQHLRTDYALDAKARVPDDCRDPLGHFLLEARRGPDYQFATAAAILPRVLGYPTRLVSGFYVSPEHYDPLTQHTPVVPEDLHFWAEVLLPSGGWLILEPTPGYEVLGPNLSWSERLWADVAATAMWIFRHPIELSLGSALLALLWWRRRELLDSAAVTLLRCFPGQTWRQCVGRALWLLEMRGRWVGRSRQTSQTVPTWLGSVLPRLKREGASPPVPAHRRAGALPLQPVAESDIDQLRVMAEWAAYGHDLEPPWQGDQVLGVCRRVLAAWTLRRWRGAS